jgi:hypothetical protein
MMSAKRSSRLGGIDASRDWEIMYGYTYIFHSMGHGLACSALLIASSSKGQGEQDRDDRRES